MRGIVGTTIAGIVALAGPAAFAQVKPGSQQGLGLTGASVPPILQQVRADPYRWPVAPACDTIPRELLALDQVLGPDVDGLTTRSHPRDMAAGYVRGMIPYHGVVRFLTGADNKDRKLQAAATAGYARRGFLRGVEANLHCAQAVETKLADVSDRVADIKVARAEPTPAPNAAPGEEIARQMLTPVLSEPAAATPATPAFEATPVSAHVVYQLVDTVSGRPIVPTPSR
jgi:hypothetical protein